MVAYLDDWLFFADHHLPVAQIRSCLVRLGITINSAKSILQPTTALVYFGLQVDTLQQTIRPTRPCLAHLTDLIEAVPPASQMDLQRIVGYLA